MPFIFTQSRSTDTILQMNKVIPRDFKVEIRRKGKIIFCVSEFKFCTFKHIGLPHTKMHYFLLFIILKILFSTFLYLHLH